MASRSQFKLFGLVGFFAFCGLSAWAASGSKSKAKVAAKTAVSSFKNWGLSNLLQSHIHALDAWKISTGSRDVVVSVIDTGIDATHPDLAKNLWKDKTRPQAGIYGWNFISNKPNPGDELGHGTHVSGIIGAVSDPQKGISGVAHQVSIMPLKYYSDYNRGSANLEYTIKAINYAIDHGAKIINYSGGGPKFVEEEYLALKRAEAQGVLFVAAAGNDGNDTDQNKNFYYPSAYGLKNIISVAATNEKNQLLGTSNWGKKKVDLAAPGENIFSTLPGGRSGTMTGTSQATAFVTGVAALLLSQNAQLTPEQLKQILVESVDRLPQLKNKVASGGRLNAYAALLKLKNERFKFGGKPGLLAQKPQSILDLMMDAQSTE